MENKIVMETDRQKFIDHVKRICRSNMRKPCKICLQCPWKKYVLKIMEENNWKLPEEAMKKLKEAN